MTRVVALALVLVACNKNSAPPPPPLAEAPLVTAGARCADGKCTCRALDNYGRATGDPASRGTEGEIAAGQKRFEFRTGRGFDRTSVTIESRGTLLKDTTMPESACAYVDLPPGHYRVVVRVQAKDKGQGIQPHLMIKEYGSETKDWYDSFGFSCGGVAQGCIKDDMNIWLDQVRSVPRGIFDKCGSTRATDISWRVEHSPEQAMQDLVLELTRVQVPAALPARDAHVQRPPGRARLGVGAVGRGRCAVTAR
jgi:hypothetical protein